MIPPDPSDSDGIVLQFAKTKLNHPRTRNQVARDKLHESLIQLSPSSTVSLSSVRHGATRLSEEKLSDNTIKHGATDFSEQGIEWMESEPSQHSLATRSLSAVKRKEPYKKSMGGGEICDMDEVLEALENENESLTNLHVNMDNKSPLAGDKVGDVKKTFDNFSSITMTELERGSKNSIESATPRIKGPLLPSLPFRPVLVNRYKQAIVTAKTLAGPRDAATKPMPLAREEEYTTAAQQQRQSQASNGVGGREEHVARESLTEHTVKIITDKVRQMDAR